jgi:hypothetical protein
LGPFQLNLEHMRLSFEVAHDGAFFEGTQRHQICGENMTKFCGICSFVLLVGELQACAPKSASNEEWTLFKPPTARPSCYPTDIPGRGVEARGDFNGDGRPDVARIEVSLKNQRGRLAVWLNGDEAPPLVLREWKDVREENFVGPVEPSTQQTWCGKTGQCGPGDVPTIVLKRTSIAFGACQSSEEIFYWVFEQQQFKEVWISD